VDEVTPSDGERAMLGAARTESYLQRWASIQPDQPRPHEEWAEQILWRQSLLQCDAQPTAERELSREALERLERALTLRGDTTPEDRVRLAVLSLAAGEPAAAVSLAEAALIELRTTAAAEGGALAPGAAANVFMATGKPERAAEILAPAWPLASFAAEDPLDGSLVFAGQVGASIGVLRVFGATGVAGDRTTEAFAALAREWEEPGYTARQAALLRQAALESMGLGPALTLDATARAAWFDGWSEYDLAIPDVWRGLIAADQGRADEARQQLDRVVAGQARGPTRPREFYLTGVLAAAVGADSTALDAYRSAASCPASIGLLDDTWGLRPSSLYRAAAAAERVGSDSVAADLYEAVRELWQDADPPLSFAADTARNALSRLR
jgi:hypothetical protein